MGVRKIMKFYLITYLKTEIYTTPKLVEHNELVKTNNIELTIEKIKKRILKLKSNIFPNQKFEFVLKDIKKL